MTPYDLKKASFLDILFVLSFRQQAGGRYETTYTSDQ
jgi:hypothetical protein